MGPPLPPVSPPIHKYTILLASLAVAVQDRASEVSSGGPMEMKIWQRHVEGSCFKQVDDNWRCQLLNGDPTVILIVIM